MVERSVVRIKCGQIYLLSDDNFSLICEFCDRDFYTLADLRAHLRAEHLPESQTNINIEESFSCGDCASIPSEAYDVEGKLFDETAALTASKKLYETFRNEQNEVNQHKPIRDLQSNNENEIENVKFLQLPISTNEVDRTDATGICSSELDNIELHGSIPEKPDNYIANPISSKFECSFCKVIHHDDHEYTHRGKRPYVCPICFKNYGFCSNLSNHLWNVHKERRENFGTCAQLDS